MKRMLFVAALMAALPWGASAQVEKRVEVTKAYVPSVEGASKLAVVPDMTDTVKMRPEIDYTITPLSLQTTLATRPIRPATVTYWEFNRPLPFYLKAGMGYPFNSVLDFYASSQNPGTGYVVGYVNHEGRYSKIGNDFGVKNNSTRMLNRIGAAAGKYFGRHVLEGDLSYENRIYHRYGLYLAPDFSADAVPGSPADYGDANIARAFGRHRLAAEVGYERLAGQKALDEYNQQRIHAALRYGIEGGVVRLEAGADYYHDKIKSVEAENYILPFVRLNLNLGTDGLCPFFEMDGSVDDNSYRSLTKLNPYLLNPVFGTKSSVDYNGRFGIGGSIWRGKFDYRAYAGFSIRDNHLYWYSADVVQGSDILAAGLTMLPSMARQPVLSFNGEVTWRPASSFRTELGVHGYIYNDDETKLHNGAPAFDGNFSAHYDGRKISFGAGIWLQSTRKWSDYQLDAASGAESFGSVEVPFAADLRVNFDWKVSGRITLFAEGRNLINRRLYQYPWYPEYGANFTVGVKANF